MEDRTLLRCQCGSPFDFTDIRKCPGCDRYLCDSCAKPFRGKFYCKPCRKVRADAASRGIEIIDERKP
jgi:hypothetical protein